ncbi:oligoendopeptidase F [Lacticaseibacillus mingshuiensis]|uniref:Oligopeptidase F n=1 Tax=Lacticaseibacillus mingshuiensis TaxID=2799574 RepID=A0ABW4CGA2_9LACO|nr:oligoendopeptidase F [Lacticaseibacillus mingshuiensis]
MTAAQAPRKDYPETDKWDLTAIYASDTAYEQDIKKLQELAEDFTRIYQGRLNEVGAIKDALADMANIQTIADHLSHYAFLPQSADTTDPAANHQLNRINQLFASVFGQLTFFDTELQAQSNELLDEVAATDEDTAAVIRHIKAAKAHELPGAVEQVLTQLGPTLDTPNAIRDQMFADMDFGSFTVAGKTYPLSFTLYEEEYQKHPDTAVRRAAYHQFCDTLARYQNTMAAAYYNQVAKEKTLATLRGYESVFDYLLAPQEVTRAMFDRQIDGLMKGLAPLMQRYVTHLKKLWGLDHIGYTDLQIDIDPEFAPAVTRAEAPSMVNDALAPMGPAYQDLIAHAFPQRWVDFAPNAGKASGAFATMPYAIHPYVLMSWSDTLPALYTLIHELGHTGQMTLASRKHDIMAANPSTYVVEGPSTFHELLLTKSLLAKASDPRLKRFALSRLLSDTYFHNCVTHLLEAAFQREVYTLIDNGESFNAAKLNELKLQVLHQFWGDAVDLTDGRPELTWMRQSHYYMGLYSYTYSASMVISTGAFLRLQNGDENAIHDWQEFLALGDTKTPLEEAKVAGVDISTAKPLENMVAFLDETEKQIEALSAEID